jgi:hypothetical protein
MYYVNNMNIWQIAPIFSDGTKRGPNPLKTLGHGTKIAATHAPGVK